MWAVCWLPLQATHQVNRQQEGSGAALLSCCGYSCGLPCVNGNTLIRSVPECESSLLVPLAITEGHEEALDKR